MAGGDSMMDLVDSYLTLRRAAGFELKMAEYMLRSYARFAAARGESHVRSNTVIDWASQASSVAQRDVRLKTVARFAEHIYLEDQRHQVPPRDLFGYRKSRRVPFIYTRKQINALIGAASSLGPHSSLQPHTYSTLFALLVATGLRISEALKLRMDDVKPEGLIVTKTKFQKSRLVPLHETAAVGLERYLVLRKRDASSTNFVFISQRGRPLSRQTVHATFRRLIKTIGLDSGSGGRRPRIHDIRHTFAVRVLETCPEGRDKVSQHMLALSTYMGHTNVNSTYWYLDTTPHLMRDISQAAESFFAQGTNRS
jgi:integrase/recombinase XerD